MGHVKTLSPEEKVRIRVIRKSRIRQQMLLQDDDARNSLEQKAIDERLRKIEEEKAEMDRSVPRANRDSQSHNDTVRAHTFVKRHRSGRFMDEEDWTAKMRSKKEGPGERPLNSALNAWAEPSEPVAKTMLLEESDTLPSILPFDTDNDTGDEGGIRIRSRGQPRPEGGASTPSSAPAGASRGGGGGLPSSVTVTSGPGARLFGYPSAPAKLILPPMVAPGQAQAAPPLVPPSLKEGKNEDGDEDEDEDEKDAGEEGGEEEEEEDDGDAPAPRRRVEEEIKPRVRESRKQYPMWLA